MQQLHFAFDACHGAEADSGFAAKFLAELHLAGKSERTGHAVDAAVWAVTRGYSRGVGAGFEFGVVILFVLDKVSSRERQGVEVGD